MRLRIAPSGPLRGELYVVGDKSIGHRALLLAGLADGTSVVRGLGGGEDNRRTLGAVAALGAQVRAGEEGELHVEGVGSLEGLRPPAGPIDCGNSGTTMRLLCGVLAGAPFETLLVGDGYLHRRPMRRVVEPLARMGAAIAGADGARPGELYPPLRIAGRRRLSGLDHTLAVASAQVKSALLLAGLAADGEVVVREPGPTRDHTERMLAALGAPLTVEPGGVVRLDPRGWSRRLRAAELTVPGDLSAAAFLLAAAAARPGSDVRLCGVGVNPTRTGVLDALTAMGAELAVEAPRTVCGEPVADLRVRGGARLRGVELAGELVVRAIDELPVLAALATLAEGVTLVRDAGELRVKETDRIAAMARELRAMGADVEELPDGLRVRGPTRPRGGVVSSHGDHRVAMSCAVLALAGERETIVDDADNVATSFPGFVDALVALGAEIEALPAPAG